MKTPLQLHMLIDNISTRTWEPAYDDIVNIWRR